MVTTPLAPHVGVEVTGVSGRELVDPARAEECRAALDRHGVVVYREADPSDDELVGFSRLLGEVVPNPTGEHEHPEIAAAAAPGRGGPDHLRPGERRRHPLG